MQMQDKFIDVHIVRLTYLKGTDSNEQEVKVIWQKAASSPQRSMPEVLWQSQK